jgi:hypothetical protein
VNFGVAQANSSAALSKDSFMENNDTYLGDGLYATHDNWTVELYASNGIHKTDRVFLDAQTLKAFLAYVEPLKGGSQNG